MRTIQHGQKTQSVEESKRTGIQGQKHGKIQNRHTVAPPSRQRCDGSLMCGYMPTAAIILAFASPVKMSSGR